MSSLLDSVGVVVSFFVQWLTSLTTALIGNPVVQLVFASGLVFVVLNFILSLIFNNKKSKSSNISITYNGKNYYNDWEFIEQFEKEQWDNDSFL